MMTVLLLIILILLVAVIILMFTIWPRRQRAEIEKAISGLRREMAEHRGDSIRLMQVIRNEVEDAVQEVLEHEMTDYFRRGSGSQATLQRSRNASADPGLQEASGSSGENIAASPDAEDRAQQMSLFQERAKGGKPLSSEAAEESETETKETDAEPMEKVQAVLHDDIPDIDDIPDLEDTK